MKQYIGDGVYIEFDGYSLILTTENGIKTTNTIVLEPEIYTSLVDFVKRTVNTEDSNNIEQ